jgi:TnpA family transposase
MASIERTAYPRFKRQVSARELRDVYTASPDEIDWARGLTRSDEHLLALTVLLKCFQRLGYFPRLEDVPRAVVEHVRDGLGLAEEVPISLDADRTTRYHKSLVRDQLGVTAEPERARSIAEEAIRSVAAVKDNPADLINVALEELIRARCELPAYSTLDRLAGRIRAEVNGTIFELVHRRISPADRARLLSLLECDPITRRSGFDLLKQPAPAATLSRFRQHLELMGWLDVLGATDAWLTGVPAAKVSHFAGEAGVLDASELSDVGEVKRIVLVACLLHQARVRARDDLAEMFCKRMAAIHKKGRELLAMIQERHRERSERMISVFGDVLAVAREAQTVDSGDDWRLRFGIEAATVLDNAGGLEELATEHEELSAHHGNNYLPLLDRFYRGHRPLLFKLASVLVLESTSADRTLLDALEFALANEARTAELVPDHVDGVAVDTSFALEAWQRVIRDRRRPGKLVRRHFEVCVFSHLADELRSGDVAVVGSASYANWQTQLLPWEECEPMVAGYCAEAGLPSSPSEFTDGLRTRLAELAASVDAGYPDNADLMIDEGGRAVLKARKGKERRTSALALEAAIKDRLPERSLLDILARVSRATGWHRHFGPLSGSDPKLADPLERYILVAFTYGCNLGPSQAARHLRGLVTAHELGATARRHVTAEKLNLAQADIINWFKQLDLARLWGDGSSVVADGTKYEIYVDNLLAEYHIRYGGYGGIAYHHVADNYIALFSRFIPCGVWEAVYIIEALLENLSEVQPDTIHSDTQGQSFPVFGLAYLLGFDLLPRIRNWKERTFFRVDQETQYTHIDALFGEPGRNVINWRLIETHWQDLMRVVLSIREGRLSSVTLLRRLRYDSKRNRVYRAFRELGRVIATMVLLRTISDPEMRERTGRAMTMVESYNGFAKWIFFGNEGVIADNDPDDHEKAIKFNDLVANLVILSTTLDISAAVNRLLAQGFPVYAEDLATISPYQKDNVKRFGEYILDMRAAAGELDGRLELPANLAQPGSVIAGNGSSPAGTTSEKQYSRK